MIEGNTFDSNGSYGIYNADQTTIVIAQNNNWGDPSGPYDPSDDRGTGGWYNPGGLGNRVSDQVNYFPWTGSITQTDLSITQTDFPDPVTVGGNLTYTINVTNNEPNPATGVTVTDSLPVGVTWVSAVPSQGSCNGSGLVTCNLDTLASGASATITIVVIPNSQGMMTNTSTVTSNEVDPYTGNNTASATTTVNPIPVDIQPPILNITSHSNNQHVITPVITLAGTASDGGNGDNGIQQVLVNGDRANNDTAGGNGTAVWTKNITLSAGLNRITVAAYDNSSNHNAAAQTLTLYYDLPDTTAPSATIVSPTSNPLYITNSSPSNIGGTATDDKGVVAVGWVSDRGGSGTCTGTTSWNCSGITLYSSQNIITVTARDQAGNTGQATLTVHYDLTAPFSSISDPLNGAMIMGMTYVIKGAANDDQAAGVKKGGSFNRWRHFLERRRWHYLLDLFLDTSAGWHLLHKIESHGHCRECGTPGSWDNGYRSSPAGHPCQCGQWATDGQRQPLYRQRGGVFPGADRRRPGVGIALWGLLYGQLQWDLQPGFAIAPADGGQYHPAPPMEQTADHLDFLDQAYHNGDKPIYVIPDFQINPDLNIDPGSPDREKLTSDFRRMVALHKNHPAILMWSIGNNLNQVYSGNLDNLFSLINDLALAGHEEEGESYHPVTTALADMDLAQTLTNYGGSSLSLDVWGANVYRGNSFGDLFSSYTSNKPLLIMGFGIDAFDQVNGMEYEAIGRPYQAEYAQTLWGEITENSGVCLGGVIRSFSDEWWLGKSTSGSGCPDLDPSTHGLCGYEQGNQPDGYTNEEWWGIMRSRVNGSGLDLMEPRSVYYRLQSIWNPPAYSVLINGDEPYTRTTAVTLTVACADITKCVQMQVSNNGSTWSGARILPLPEPGT